LSAVPDTLFNIIAATINIGEAVPSSATSRRSMPWRQEPTYHGILRE